MKRVQAIDEGFQYGVYTWEVGGRPVVDEDLNYLVAPARRGDVRAIARLTEFVNKELGIYEGGPVFRGGTRPISQEEWEDQMARQLNGEVADPYDIGNLIDEYKYQKELDKQ
jgi:hypothetical protein